MLYLEELVDAVISEEGQTLMGLDFLFETLALPMKKIEIIFKKSLRNRFSDNGNGTFGRHR